MKMKNDYEDYVGAEAADAGELSQLSALAELQAKAEAEVARLEAELAAAKEAAADLSERRLPELMDKIGMEEFKTASGLKIKINETIRASIPKAVLPRACQWLRDNGHAAMIKRLVSVSFGKGEDEKAEALLEQLSKEYEAEDAVSVHPSTLSAFVREKLRDGEELPLDLFGVHRQRVSKIVPTKAGT